jgi:exopolyphosphatase/guanosine-5'-triphosphate,3'-diphosphate pyrophosphatase
MPRYASIDIGTQTIRLLVADTGNNGGIVPIYRDRSIVRLGQGMNESKQLQNEPMNRALSCIKKFVMSARQNKADHIFAVATACVREARNGPDFLQQVFSETQVSVRLLTGEEEANLSLLGVQSIFKDRHNRSLIIDIGGGSTELILTSSQSIECVESIPLGVVTLSEQYLQHDPPLKDDLNILNHTIRSIILTNSNIINNLIKSNYQNVRIIGTAGTVTTLAAMDLKLVEYHIDKVNKHVLSYNCMNYLYNMIINLNSKERVYLPGLEPGREIVIIAGTAIVLTIMELLNVQELSVSDAGLLEGILLEKAGVNT